MGLRIDIHVHTNRYSLCSAISPERLIMQAIRQGLDGLVITEHHYQWSQDELDALVQMTDAPGFLILTGFECTTAAGDVLIYGLSQDSVSIFSPGLPVEEVIERVHEKEGVCIAAHPTRAGLGFGSELLELNVDAIETASVNMQSHEQSLARRIAQGMKKPMCAGSDAHRLQDLGRYFTVFDEPVQDMDGLKVALRNGSFSI